MSKGSALLLSREARKRTFLAAPWQHASSLRVDRSMTVRFKDEPGGEK